MSVNIAGYKKIKQALDKINITLVAVSKTKTQGDIKALYDVGQKDFGENYVQELVEKHEALAKDIRWHFIGHLQSNKVKYLAAFVHLVHGVDSENLLLEINKQGKKINRCIDCLLQVYISKDANKFGFDEKELEKLIKKINENPEAFRFVSIKGLMGMATFTEDNALIITEFQHLKSIYDNLNTIVNPGTKFTTLSMGMSADYSFAVEAGTSMVRIGSLLFGDRNNKS